MVTTTTDEHKYRSIVTDRGKEKIAAATLTGKKVNIIYAAVGDGGGEYMTPSPEMAELVNEVWRGEIAYEQINPESKNMIDVKVIIPADVGGFTVREAGFFDTDGDMIAICNIPPTEKVVISTGAAGTLTLLAHIVFTDVDTVEFTINPMLDSVSAAEVREMIQEHNKSEKAHAEILSQLNTSSVTIIDIAIPTTDWIADTDTGGAYAFCANIPSESITEAMIPMLTILPSGHQAAKECNMSNAVRTIDGALRVYAQKIPAAEIPCSLTLISIGGGAAGGGGAGGYTLPVASATRLGGVKIGEGVSVEHDGTISVDAAAAVAGVTASDGDAEAMLQEVFGETGTGSGNS